MYTFNYKNSLFRIDVQDSVMASYEEQKEATTVYNIYIHDAHVVVSDSVDRQGVWVPILTIHWKEVRDSNNLDVLGAGEVSTEQVEEFIRDGNYEDLIDATIDE